jgi:predicted nucleic acid-binding protein
VPPLRRLSERNVYSFEGTLLPPGELVLETSFVVEALIPTQARHAECRAFLAAIGDARSTAIFNRLLEPELSEASYKIALRELHPKKRLQDVRQDGRARRRANALRGEVQREWDVVLSALDSVLVDLAEVRASVPEMMGHGLTAYDAIHAATATYADVRALVTLDYHFALVPARELQLWVPSSRLRPCRERRRGRK